ncbi:MAG TPA: 5'/3'-nucleotidase SurE [Blastocatellia bacterium]|jgi:5'-nucleotidase|nr:5'/3'-nucleotidase SurE [Blastocatellia bacterium]
MATILVTNDDGIHSAGIIELARSLEAIADVFVVAPAHEMSAASRSLTLARPLRIDKIDDRHYSVDGTPTDCVTLAMNSIMRNRPPDMVFSGINKGGNLGDDVSYSGTVAGALEASIYGLPGVAMSLVQRVDFDFGNAAQLALEIGRRVLDNGLPRGTMLNVNVPPGPIHGLRMTRQGSKIIRPNIVEGTDPRQRSYYWIGEEALTWNEEEGTDYEALRHGFASITPLRSDLTDHRVLEQIKAENWDTLLNSQSK